MEWCGRGRTSITAQGRGRNYGREKVGGVVCVWWGGDQLSTSSAPGRGAEQDRPSRRHSFIHVHRDELISG